MKRAKLKDQHLVTEILSKAFSDNMSVNYVVKQDKYRLRRIERLMQYSFQTCIDFGEVWISENEQGCALLLYPDKIKKTFKGVLRDLNLAINVIGLNRVLFVLKRERNIKSRHPNEPFCHLWFIAINPSCQKKGYGSKLLQNIIVQSKNNGRPIYLETSVDSNLSWYQRYGFEIFNTIDLTYKLHMLKRVN
jgi:ribosomal protein S18 acetylase RimI-like enzyme